VLISGLYDLPAYLAHPKTFAAATVKFAAWDEAAGENDALRSRSALYVAQDIKAKTLIMNGALDDRTDPNQARLLADEINAHGGAAKVHIYPEYGHQIPFDVRKSEVDAFIDSVFK
jgi:dipeptidyl aminopeptidase/acylaminoacyl peptidase